MIMGNLAVFAIQVVFFVHEYKRKFHEIWFHLLSSGDSSFLTYFIFSLVLRLNLRARNQDIRTNFF